MNNYNSKQSQKLSNNNQCYLKIKPGEDDKRCIWCVNFSLQNYKKTNSFTLTKEQPTPSPTETKWKDDFKDRRVGIWELCGNECLDFLMPVQSRSSNQVLNNINSVKRSNVAMRELQGLSELVDIIKNDCRFCEFQPKHEWLIDQENKEFFSDAYGITNINPLLVDNHGMTVLFLDNRGILFEWCELTRDMYVLGINEMEGLANFLYYPEKKLIIMEETGEMIPNVELERQAKEFAEAEYANLTKA